MKLLFKNAYIVDVQSPYHLQTVDVLVDEDQIVSVGALGEISAKHTIDLNGSTLTTGFAELHSDLGEPGNEESEDLNSGSAAAAAGGFTAVGVVSWSRPCCHPITRIDLRLHGDDPSGQPLRRAFGHCVVGSCFLRCGLLHLEGNWIRR